MNLVLDALKESLFTANQSVIFLISLLISEEIVSMLQLTPRVNVNSGLVRVVSSA